MARTILCSHENMAHESTTVTGGTTASSSMSVQNVLTPQPSEFTRFSDALAANTYLVIRSSYASVAAAAVFVGYSNVSSEATIRLRTATTEGNLTASPTYDTGAVNFWHDTSVGRVGSGRLQDFPRGGHHLFSLEASQARDWCRIDIDDESDNPDGYVEVGVVNIARTFEATNPINNGWSFGVAPLWAGQTAMAGQRYRRSVSAATTLEATWQMTSQSEANALHTFARKNAEGKPVLCVIDADDDTGIMNNLAWGHMTMTQPIAVPYFGLWQTTLRVEEMP